MVKENIEKKLGYLLLQLKNKDQNAFGQLYDLMHDEIFRYIYSIVKSREKAQDLTHDTFIQIYKKAINFNNHHPKAWIITVSRNVTYMALRKDKREVLVDYEIEHIDGKMHDNLHHQILIEKMLQLLKKEEREIIVLHIIEGFSFNEIARITNMKLPTVLSKYHRSLKKLKASMEV